jgi:hypothetical protein
MIAIKGIEMNKPRHITIQRTLMLFVLFVFVFSSCKKDDTTEAPQQKNHFNADGTDYELSHGFLSNLGMEGSTYRINLNLMSSGLTVHEQSGLPDSISGTGNEIAFELYCASSGVPATGDYVFNPSHIAGTFYLAGYSYNWNSAINPQPEYTTIILGTLKIIKNDPEYEISFSGTDSHNASVTAYYKGALKYYTYSGDEKLLATAGR